MHDVWGDYPTWIMAILTPVSIGGGFFFTWLQLRQTRKIEEQKFFIEIDNRLMRKDNLNVSRNIYDELYNSKNYEIKEDSVKSAVSNYLTDLEYICNLYEEKILSKKQFLIFMEDQVTEAMKCKSIHDFIGDERKKTKKYDLYEIVERVAKKLDTTQK